LDGDPAGPGIRGAFSFTSSGLRWTGCPEASHLLAPESRARDRARGSPGLHKRILRPLFSSNRPAFES